MDGRRAYGWHKEPMIIKVYMIREIGGARSLEPVIRFRVQALTESAMVLGLEGLRLFTSPLIYQPDFRKFATRLRLSALRSLVR